MYIIDKNGVCAVNAARMEAIYINDNRIIAEHAAADIDNFILAEYQTQEMAKFVFRDILHAMNSGIFVYEMPSDKFVKMEMSGSGE